MELTLPRLRQNLEYYYNLSKSQFDNIAVYSEDQWEICITVTLVSRNILFLLGLLGLTLLGLKLRYNTRAIINEKSF